jgi:hypothetical protein
MPVLLNCLSYRIGFRHSGVILNVSGRSGIVAKNYAGQVRLRGTGNPTLQTAVGSGTNFVPVPGCGGDQVDIPEAYSAGDSGLSRSSSVFHLPGPLIIVDGHSEHQYISVDYQYRRAALYHELHGDMEKTLEYYRVAGASEKIRDILIKNARLHPGLGDYFVMRKYYQILPESLIRENPILIAGISVMYSLSRTSCPRRSG